MFLFSKIAVAIFLTLIAVSIAEILGFLDKKYGDYIFFIGLSIQIIILTIMVIAFLIRKSTVSRGIKIIRYKIMDKYIKGGTELSPSYITPTNPRKSAIFKIFIEAENFEHSPNLEICKIGQGNITIDDKQILSVRTAAGEKSFIFDADIIVRPGEKINCKLSDDVNIKTFFIGELYIP